MAGLVLCEYRARFPGLGAPVLDIPKLRLAGGERVALTGPSGSGKTTLINALTGLERASEGTVTWYGTEIGALGETGRDRWRAAQVGLVMQDFHLFAGLSALDNVLLPSRLAFRRLPQERLAEAGRLLARVGLGDRLGQKVETLSRGQMQRVAVARALVGRPRILVADEPTASLDAEAGAEVAALLLELAGEAGATLIVASHDPRLIGRLSRVWRLDAGRLTEG